MQSDTDTATEGSLDVHIGHPNRLAVPNSTQDGHQGSVVHPPATGTVNDYLAMSPNIN